MEKFGQNRRWVVIVSIIVVLIAVVIGGYLAWKKDGGTTSIEKKRAPTELPRMANLPPNVMSKPKPTAPSYPPDAPVLEKARKALREGIEPSKAVDLAKSFPDRPESPDAAFLLLEYAAEGGNTEAALAVGQFYDPAYKGPSGTIQKNPETAYEWYRQALDGGEEKVKTQLAGLRRWLKEQAAQGSGEAQELLNKWP